jgi:hypothetical protein
MSLVILAVGLLFWSAQRALALCVLSVRDGRMIVLRGNLPQGLFDALADVMSRACVQRATLTVWRNQGSARVSASGLPEFALQRVRNVVGTYPYQRLVSASWPVGRNLGQRLGIAWLARRLKSRSKHSAWDSGSSEPRAGREPP